NAQYDGTRTQKNSTAKDVTSRNCAGSEKKMMSRLVPGTGGARMAHVSTVQLEILEARGHEYACCGGRDPSRDRSSNVGARDRGTRGGAVAQQVEDAGYGRRARPVDGHQEEGRKLAFHPHVARPLHAPRAREWYA